MVISCYAVNCTRKQGDNDISFHRFPDKLTKRDLYYQWKVAIRRERYHPTQYSYVCSAHFQACDFTDTSARKRLQSGAVPSIFVLPEHLQKRPPQTRTISVQREQRKRVAESAIVNEEIKRQHIEACVAHDHSYTYTTMDQWRAAMLRYKRLSVDNRKKYQAARVKAYRRNRRIASLKNIISCLRKHNLMNPTIDSLLEGLPPNKLNIFRNELVNVHRNPRGRRFSTEMRRFAMTLFFHSPRAYEFVRQHALCLPHPSTIRKWSSAVGGNPGVTAEVISMLHAKRLTGAISAECVLVMDAMDIKRQLCYDKNADAWKGKVDYGEDAYGLDEADKTLASQALVVMAVGLKERWRYPVAYFLTNTADADCQAEIIRTVIDALKESLLSVKAIVFDCHATNIATASRLGANVSDYDSLQPYFTYNGEVVHIIVDVCHVFKLLRNVLAEEGVLATARGLCRWKHIEQLYDYQNRLSLRLANKLSKNHILWQGQKMKMKLAVQTLSSSVATSLELLQKRKVAGFEDVGPLIGFLRAADELFDRLNCSNPQGKGFKAPLRRENFDFVEERVRQLLDTLKEVKLVAGPRRPKRIPLLTSRKKFAILGFVVSAQSILRIAKDLLFSSYSTFTYLLTYKFSQDHLEIFFSNVRRRGGYNNNPNAVQFRQVYRRIIAADCLQHMSAHGNANCKEQHVDDSDSDQAVESPRLLPTLDQVAHDVVAYIAGYVASCLLRKISCEMCRGALISCDEHLLINLRDNGGLVHPSADVVSICLACERVLSTTGCACRQRHLAHKVTCCKQGESTHRDGRDASVRGHPSACYGPQWLPEFAVRNDGPDCGQIYFSEASLLGQAAE